MPRRNLTLQRSVELDIAGAALWYEDERQGLGLEFLEQIELVFERISVGPHQFPIIEGEIRRALLHRFPYSVYFIPKEATISIIALLHLHRHPDTWKHRGKC